MQFFFQFFLFMWRERLCFHVLHYYNVPHVLFSQTALTLWQPFWLKSLADQYAEYYSLSIYQGFRLSKIQVKGYLLLAGVTSIQANLVSTNWRPHCNLSVGRTWYKITWVSVPKMWRGILACITGALWAKRGESGICLKRETRDKER